MQYLGMGVEGAAAIVKGQDIEIDRIHLVMSWPTIVLCFKLKNQSPLCSVVGCEFRLCGVVTQLVQHTVYKLVYFGRV